MMRTRKRFFLLIFCFFFLFYCQIKCTINNSKLLTLRSKYWLLDIVSPTIKNSVIDYLHEEEITLLESEIDRYSTWVGKLRIIEFLLAYNLMNILVKLNEKLYLFLLNNGLLL